MNSKESKKRVLIVTPDIMGPIRNGGVGTICALLAFKLADAGYNVEVIFADLNRGENPNRWQHWVRKYKRAGVTLSALKLGNFDICAHHWAKVSYLVYEQIKMRTDDLLVFPDMMGVAYYSLQAKKLGIALNKSTILTLFAGPSTWSRRDNHAYWSSPSELLIPMFERISIEWSDHIQFASRWSLDWCKRNRWKTPPHSELLFPLAKPKRAPKISTTSEKTAKANELVFFGRLEDRKGLKQFIGALELLSAAGQLDYSKVTFLGRVGFSHGESTLKQIGRLRLFDRRGRKIRVQTKTQLQSDEAIAYLKSNRVIAVVMSRSETMGYTLVECLTHAIPVIASSIEPFEKIAGPALQKYLCPIDTPKILAQAISSRRAILDSKRASVLWIENHRQWLDLCSKLTKSPTKSRSVNIVPSPIKVSVLIPHYARPDLLREALLSLLQQTLMPTEILIYDDASPNKSGRLVFEEFEKRFAARACELKLFEGEENRGPSYARNFLSTNAKGDFVLFMDDDNRAMRNEIELLSNMQSKTNADVIVVALKKFMHEQEGLWTERRWVPLGFDTAVSILENGLGDTNFLIRKTTFKEAGGFIDRADFKAEDMNLLMKVARTDAKMFVCPEPLVEYRVHTSNRSHERDPAERLFHANNALREMSRPEFAEDPKHSLEPISDFMVHAAEMRGSLWNREPMFFPRAASRAELRNSLKLHLKLPALLGKISYSRVGAAYAIPLDRNSNLKLNLGESITPSGGLLDLTMTIQKSSTLRCSNKYFELELNPGICNIRIPVTKAMASRPFQLTLPGISKVFISQLIWIPVRNP